MDTPDTPGTPDTPAPATQTTSATLTRKRGPKPYATLPADQPTLPPSPRRRGRPPKARALTPPAGQPDSGRLAFANHPDRAALTAALLSPDCDLAALAASSGLSVATLQSHRLRLSSSTTPDNRATPPSSTNLENRATASRSPSQLLNYRNPNCSALLNRRSEELKRRELVAQSSTLDLVHDKLVRYSEVLDKALDNDDVRAWAQVDKAETSVLELRARLKGETTGPTAGATTVVVMFAETSGHRLDLGGGQVIDSNPDRETGSG